MGEQLSPGEEYATWKAGDHEVDMPTKRKEILANIIKETSGAQPIDKHRLAEPGSTKPVKMPEGMRFDDHGVIHRES